MESKKSLFLVLTSTCLALVGVITFATIDDGNFTSSVLAYRQTNEYGCAGNCTGEYEIRHVKQLIKEDETKNGSQNVRLLVKVSKTAWGYQWYQDINDDTNIQSIYDVTNTVIENQLMNTSGIAQGFDATKFQQGDVVGVVGTVNWKKSGFGGYTLEVTSPIFYKWNEKQDLTLLPPVTYLS